MSLPIVEEIAVVIFSRLDKLAKKYDVTTNLAAAVRPTKVGGFTPQDGQIELTEGEEEVDESLSHPGNPPATARIQTFNILARAMPSEKDPTPIGKIISEMKADIVRTICTPAATWHTFGGFAINARWGSPEKIAPGGEFDGVTMPMMVTYRTDENNPYNFRA